MDMTQLQPGMLIRQLGLILDVDLTNEDEFYSEPNVRFLPIWGTYYGACGTILEKGREYTVLHPIGSNAYRQLLTDMVEEMTTNVNNIQTNIDQVRHMIGSDASQPPAP